MANARALSGSQPSHEADGKRGDGEGGGAEAPAHAEGVDAGMPERGEEHTFEELGGCGAAGGGGDDDDGQGCQARANTPSPGGGRKKIFAGGARGEDDAEGGEADDEGEREDPALGQERAHERPREEDEGDGGEESGGAVEAGAGGVEEQPRAGAGDEKGADVDLGEDEGGAE
jgi:hypothetical protein